VGDKEGGGGKGGEMTQTLYAHTDKRKEKKTVFKWTLKTRRNGLISRHI
jgi:hypothetical protein